IYTMLQTGGLDGAEQPLFYHYSMKFYEVQDYLIDSKHHIYTTVTVGNANWFDSLDEEDQEIIRDAIDETNNWSFTMQEEENEKALEKMKPKIEFYALTPEERAQFKEASMGTRDIYVKNG